jgi:hypothetical protein
MKRLHLFIPVFLILLSVAGCQNGCGNKSRKTADPEDVKLEVQFCRLDTLLFAHKKPADSVLADVRKQYPEFTDIYFDGIVKLGDPSMPGFNVVLAGFLNDYYINQLYTEAWKKYGMLDEEQKQITDAFRRYHSLMPSKRIPRVVFCISALNYAVAATDSVLGVGLDMYLGPDYEAYVAMQFPEYIRMRKDKPYLVPELLQGWFTTEFPKDEKKNRLIDEMISRGKIIYLLSLVLPETPEEILMGYTPDNLKFCYDNESNIWGFFVEKKLLYNDKKEEIVKFVEEAPFSVGMPRESPGRTGVWIGKQIVHAYMKKHPDVTVEQLMQNTDYQRIFTESGYRPGK